MPDQINPQQFLQDHFKTLKANLRKEMEVLSALPTDHAAFIVDLKNRYRVRSVIFKNTEVTNTMTRPVSKRLLADRWTENVQEIKVNIYYEGDKVLFNCKPVPYTRVFPKHKHVLYSNVITVYIELPEPDEELFKKEVAEFKAEISKNFERTNNQVEFYNDELAELIERLFKVREEHFNKQANFMKKIGLKINPGSDGFMTPSLVRRKAIPLPSAERIKGVTVPVLESKVYNDIREVLYHVGQAMERKPSLYMGKREEHLRDIFLLFLETRYESTTGSGEAFNKIGKTDILLKYAGDGSNIFVAECKIWRGQKELFKAIDQLLGYLTWRDTQTALMIFVKQPDFSKALQVISLFVNRHPQFKRFVGATHNTSLAYEMILPGDPGSSVWIEFMLFHFPTT